MKTTPEGYDISTPELETLFNAMESANAAFAKVGATARSKQGVSPFTLPEYKAAKEAYRAYWLAVDSKRALAKVLTDPDLA